jgi:formate dehydrogenase subunit gamma
LRPADPPLERFDRTERVVHWVTASLFVALMLTGAALYAGPISTLVGRRDLVRDIHVVAGLALPVALVIGMVGRWGAALRRDLRRLDRWTDT